MCGLAGVLYFNNFYNDDRLSVKMINQLGHRGPDHIGNWNNKKDGIFLSHSRLSIIDISTLGNQPMNSLSNRWSMVYNGEIYNYKTLKKKIENTYNIIFRGNSDSEVLINYFDKYGINETLKAIDGMFAIALWDNFEKRLYLIRDRAGEKPIYYYVDEKAIYFASELKALKIIPNFNKQLSKNALNYYFKIGFIPSEECIYKNVKKILPGEYAEVTKNSKEIKKQKYWKIESFMDNNSKNSLIDEIDITDDLLDRSVKERLNADVAIGTLLSGGIDSSLIAYYAQKNSLKKINTYCVGFSNKSYDETERSKKISQYLNTNHTSINVDISDLKNSFSDLSNIYCEPFSDSSQLPTYLISKKISKHLKVALSGDGGDELFGGYNRHIYSNIIGNMNFLPKFIRKIIFNKNKNFLGNIISFLYSNLLNENYQLAEKKVYKFFNIVSRMNTDLNYIDILSNSNFLKILNKDYLSDVKLSEEFYSKKLISNILVNDFKYYLPDDILTKVDRASMSNSIEIRSPFLSTKLIEHSFSINNKFKIRGFKGKYILQNLIKKNFSNNLSSYSKKGFSIPLNQWMKSDLKPFFKDLLFSKSKSSDFFDESALNKIWNSFINNKFDYSEQIWSIIIFKSWYENQ